MMADAPLRPRLDLARLGGTNLNLLVPLLALLEERSISAAATRVGARHTTMVQALSRLRSMHGDELLVGFRAERTLTPYGAELLSPLQDLLRHAGELLNVPISTLPPPRDS